MWISYRSKLMKVAPEHVRTATTEEMVSEQAVLEEMAEQMTNVPVPSARTSFYDLAGRRGVPGRVTSTVEPETPRAAASKSMEPEIPAIVPDGRDAQPATEPEGVQCRR